MGTMTETDTDFVTVRLAGGTQKYKGIVIADNDGGGQDLVVFGVPIAMGPNAGKRAGATVIENVRFSCHPSETHKSLFPYWDHH